MTIPKTFIPYIVGGLALVSVSGIVAYNTTNKPENTETPESEENKTNITASLKELLSSGKNLKCTFAMDTGNSNTSGITYIGDGKVRGDFDILDTTSGKKFDSHMIVDGKVGYVWTSMTPQGFKVPITDGTAETVGQQQVNVDQRLGYDCKPWGLDRSFFDPPQDMSFVDLPGSPNASVPPTAPQGSDPKEMQCGACDQAPDASTKVQCKQALGCK